MYDFKPPYFGAAYYPEAWDRSQIDYDLDRALDHGLNCLRIAEFAWGTMEPEEGRYDFSLFREVVDKCKARGIAVIMCTPSATPPSWMEHKYPEVLAMINGKRLVHGERRKSCPTNPRFRRFVSDIVEAMAKEFANDENIIGWQIDNELISMINGMGCSCPDCVRSYHNYLKKRYGTIENLNHAWGNYVWSLHFSSFDEVDAYTKDVWMSPATKGVWEEFHSAALADFCHMQAEILKKYVKVPIGTDMMPTHQLDIALTNSKLDVAQLNFYNGPASIPMWLDTYRPLFERKFWITETAANHNGSNSPRGNRRKGFCKANSLIGIALGGEAVLYWLFRSHRGGHEIGHGSVIDAWGRDLQTSPEIRELSADLKKLAPMIGGTKLKKSGMAISFTHAGYVSEKYVAMAFIQNDCVDYHNDFLNNIHTPLSKLQYRPDMISGYADIDDYKLIISHRQYTLEEGDFLKKIIPWVEKGGTWVVGPLTDEFTADFSKYENAPFGHLEDICRIRREFYASAPLAGLQIPQAPLTDIIFADGTVMKTKPMTYDALTAADDVKVLARFAEGGDDYLPGYAAITETKVGEGRIIVLGAQLAPDDYGKFIDGIARQCGVAPVCEASETVVSSILEGEYGEVLCAIETAYKAAYAVIPFDGEDILTGRSFKAGERVQMKPYECIFAKRK